MKKLKNIKCCALSIGLATVFSLGVGVNVEAEPVHVVGFGHINFPDNVAWDEFVVKPAYFSMKDRAKKLNGVKINYDGSLKNDAYVIGTISRYELNRIWHEPRVGSEAKEVSSSKSDWYDSKGKKKTKVTTHYREEAVPVFGYSEFQGVVTAEFQLIDARTNSLLVSHYETKINDTETDALNDVLKGFYKKVNKVLKDK